MVLGYIPALFCCSLHIFVVIEMAFKTLTDMIQDIYEVGHAKQAELANRDLVNRLRSAQNSDNRQMMADILGDCFNDVASHTAPIFQLHKYDRETFGAKIGWLAQNEGMDDKQRVEFLAGVKRDIAQPALNQAIELGERQGLIKACIWTPVGETCEWCLSMAGTYEAGYASAAGFWSYHKGCDCDKTIRWKKPEEIYEGVLGDNGEIVKTSEGRPVHG
jgi:hypothetical protein